MDGSHVHASSIGQGGAQLYSGSIATPTPQAFSVASPPSLKHFGVDPDPAQAVGITHCIPAQIHQVRAGTSAYGASDTGSLSLRLLTLLDEPAPSGSSGASRRCRGCFPPSPPFRGSGCPQLHRAAATTRRTGLSPLSIDTRLVAHLTVAEFADEAVIGNADGELAVGRHGGGFVGTVEE